MGTAPAKVFHPGSKTSVIAADPTAPTGIQVTPRDGQATYSGNCFKFTNLGSATAHISWGITAASAQARAVAPTAGNPQITMALFGGAEMVAMLPLESYFSAVTTVAGSVLVQSGEGF